MIKGMTPNGIVIDVLEAYQYGLITFKEMKEAVKRLKGLKKT